MTSTRNAKRPTSMRWLNDWMRALRQIDPGQECDPGQHDNRELLMAHYVPSLEEILSDPDSMLALTNTYKKLLLRKPEDQAREAVRQFLTDACWLCAPALKTRMDDRKRKTAPRSENVTDLVALSKATLRLIKQIEKLMPVGALSLAYLQGRMDANNPVGYMAHRPNGWTSALPADKNSLPYLMQCFASDVLETALVRQSFIDVNRQSGGKISSLYFAIDALCMASMRLSTALRPLPNYSLISNIIGVLMKTQKPDVSTLRKRCRSNNTRKTQS